MAQNNHSQGIIFFASILNKMSQMFSEISSVYLQVMMNKSSVEMAPQYSVNSLFQEFQKGNENQSLGLSELDDFLSSQDEEDGKKQQQETKNKKNSTKRQALIKSKQYDKQCSISPPRQPPSSYLLFFNDHRQRIAEQFPNLNVTQLSKIASKCWKQLTPQQKKPYHDRFNQEKMKYYQALKAYNLMKQQGIGGIQKDNKKQMSEKRRKRKTNLKEKKQKNIAKESDSDMSPLTR